MDQSLENINFRRIIFFLYFSLIYLLTISELGLFNHFFIIIYVIITIIAIFVLFKNIKFNSREVLIYVGIAIILSGFALFKGSISGDAYVLWFPWAQQLADASRMPVFLENSAVFFAASDFPFFQLFLGIIFKFFPHFENLTFIVPLFFNLLTVYLLSIWFKSKKVEKYFIAFGILALICNPILAKYGWDLLQESLILFFYTVFFYFLDLYNTNKNYKNLLILIIAAVLAMMTKVSGFFVAIPLLIILLRDKWYNKKAFYPLLLLFLPVAYWLARNYIHFGNPFFPIGDNIFQGPYLYTINLYVKYFSQHYLGRLTLLGLMKDFVAFFPLIILAFWNFYKRKNYLVALPIIIMLYLEQSLSIATPGMMRHNYAILGVIIFYGVLGLKEIKSKILLSLFFLVNAATLFYIPLKYSNSGFLKPIEQKLYLISNFSQYLIDFRWFAILIITILFLIIIRRNFEVARYFIISAICLNFLNFSSIQISWLNIWSFIVLFIFILLAASFLHSRNLFIFKYLLAALIILMLFVNSIGLASSYYLAHKKFTYPKPEASKYHIILGQYLNDIEKGNKDYYILGDFPAVLGWKYGYKEVSIDNPTFHFITKGEYKDEFTSQELHDFLKKYNFKYIDKTSDYPVFKTMYKKIGDNSELFPLVYNEEGIYLWMVR